MSARRHLPDLRAGTTATLTSGDLTIEATLSRFEDGAPGELFLRAPMSGSTEAGLLDGLAVAVSIALQHGAPLAGIAEKFKGTKFPPHDGVGGHTSILDALGRWLLDANARRKT